MFLQVLKKRQQLPVRYPLPLIPPPQPGDLEGQSLLSKPNQMDFCTDDDQMQDGELQFP